MTRLTLPWTRQSRFLRALAKTACVAASARDAGIDPRTAYRWRDRDADFARRWKIAQAKGAERLHDELMERALLGRERPVFRYRPTAAHRQVRREIVATATRPGRPAPNTDFES